MSPDTGPALREYMRGLITEVTALFARTEDVTERMTMPNAELAGRWLPAYYLDSADPHPVYPCMMLLDFRMRDEMLAAGRVLTLDEVGFLARIPRDKYEALRAQDAASGDASETEKVTTAEEAQAIAEAALRDIREPSEDMAAALSAWSADRFERTVTSGPALWVVMYGLPEGEVKTRHRMHNEYSPALDVYIDRRTGEYMVQAFKE